SANESAGFSPGESRFHFAVSVLVIVIVIAYRIAGGAGFGILPADAAGKVPFGIIHNEHDNLMYVSWAEQASEGEWLFEDLYALEEHPRAFFSPYFLVVGRLAGWLGLPPQAAI